MSWRSCASPSRRVSQGFDLQGVLDLAALAVPELLSLSGVINRGTYRHRLGSLLSQDIEHGPLLIHGPPEIMALRIEREEEFIQMPLVARSGAPRSELIGIGLPEFPASLPNRLVGDDDATGEQQLFHITVAETEPEIHPDAVADDLGREPMARVGIGCGWWIHAASMAYG